VEKCLGKLREDGIPNDTNLLSKREEELRHAQDVRVLYEQKLKTAEQLYKDLRSCKNQLEAKEMELQRFVVCGCGLQGGCSLWWVWTSIGWGVVVLRLGM